MTDVKWIVLGALIAWPVAVAWWATRAALRSMRKRILEQKPTRHDDPGSRSLGESGVTARDTRDPHRMARGAGIDTEQGVAGRDGAMKGRPGIREHCAPVREEPTGCADIATMLARSSPRDGSAARDVETLLRQMPGAVAMFDTQMRYLALSQGWRDAYHLGSRALIGVSHYRIFPEIPPRWREVHRRALAGEVLSEEADQFERQDGTRQWVKWHVTPWRDEAGAIGGLLISTEDITARMRAQAVAYLDLYRYRTLMDQSADPVFVHDGSGRFVEVSQRACQSVGYTREELLTMTVVDLEVNFDLARAQAAWSLVDTGSAITLRGQHRRKDGSCFPVEVRFGVLDLDGHRLYIGAVRDVTESQEAEAAIREGQNRLRDALEAAHAGIWEWDMRTNIRFWSEEVVRMFGYAGRAFEPSYEAWLQSIHPTYREAANSMVRVAVARRSEMVFEWLVNSAGTPERWLMSRAKPFFDERGQPIRYRGIVMDITDRKRAELALRDSEQRYRTMFLTSPDAVTINRRQDGGYIDINDGFTRLFGWGAEEAVGRTSLELGIWQRSADRAALYERIDQDGHCSNFETTFLAKDRRVIAALVSSRAISIHNEACILTVTRDITGRKAAEDQLRKLSQVVEQSPESIIITDLAGRIEYVNDAFVRASGYSSAEALGRKAHFLHEDIGRDDGAGVSGLWDTLAKGEAWRGEVQNRRKDGSDYTESAIIAPIRQGDGQVTHYVALQQDMTERLESERRIQHLAYYDQLTGLPNRILLSDRLKQALSTCARLGAHGALMMIDLDDFKLLNDTFGHDMGDELLKQVGNRVRACVRRGDTLARLGGDEFMLVMSGLKGNAQDAAHYARSVAHKILETFRKEFRVSAGTHRCTASVGIAMFASDIVTGDELIKQADLAMYQAKAAGRDGVCFFDPRMEATARQRSTLERDLRRGLEEHQYLLHYQPQVDGTGRITGVEALVRWQHPARGLVSPAEFIPVAESSGLIVPLGRQIFAMALAHIVRWATMPEMAGLTVAVNVSARQIRQSDFVDQVLDALRVCGANPVALKLEITETLLIDNTESIIAKMAALKAHGVSFSLDDFGTGYSSLSYLKRLPLDQMKIDQSFVRDVLTDPNDAAIARTIIGLAASLGLNVIAEGVETEAQRDFLASAGCGAFQGYLFSRPLAPEALEAFVMDRHRAATLA